jgi:hypothetical protein
MRRLDPNTPRLVAKRFSGHAAIEILLAKKNAGFVASEVVRDAEDLAQYGLRAGQIQRLTSLPGCSCRQLVEKAGRANWTGRPKKSIKKFIGNATQQASYGAFICIVEHQLTVTESSQLVSGHILAAIRTFTLRFPAHRNEVDWERMVHAALAFVDGELDLVNCKTCSTRHLSVATGGSDRKCPLCRVAASMTMSGGKVSNVTQYLRGERQKIPPESGTPGQRRARFHVALAAHAS